MRDSASKICLCVFYTLAAQTPILYQFASLENPSTRASVNIIERTAGDWQKLVDHFHLPAHTAKNLRAMANYTPEAACREVYRKWLDGGDDLRMPRTWNTVIEVIGEIGDYQPLCREIRAALNRQ